MTAHDQNRVHQNGTYDQNEDEVAQMEMVCLSDQHNLRSMFGKGFQIAHPWIKLLMPDEVEDPGSVRAAMVFRPGSDVFAPYPNLKLVTTPAAGIEDLVDHPGIDPDVVICRMIDPEQAKMMAGFAIWQVVGWQRQLMHRVFRADARRRNPDSPGSWRASERRGTVLGA
jgi:phosphoglycerate dehydrogenase-like enzyme